MLGRTARVNTLHKWSRRPVLAVTSDGALMWQEVCSVGPKDAPEPCPIVGGGWEWGQGWGDVCSGFFLGCLVDL